MRPRTNRTVRGRHRTCATGKVRYRDLHEATHALANARTKATGNPTRRETRAYPCDVCNGGWHLTSRPMDGDPYQPPRSTP